MVSVAYLVLQGAQYDIDAPSQTPGQFWIAAGVLALAALLIVAVRYRSRIAGLTRAQRRHALRMQRALYAQRPTTLRFPASTDLSARRSAVRAVVHPDREHTPTRATVTGAVGDAIGDLRATADAHLSGVPLAAQRLGALGLWTAVTGALAVSTGLIIQVLQTDLTGRLDPLAWPQRILAESMALLGDGGQLLGQIPGGGLVLSLLTALLLTGGQWLYTHWYVGAGALLALALGSFALDRRQDTPDRGDVPLPTPRQVLVATALLVTGLWAVGLLLVVVLKTLPAVGTALVATVTSIQTAGSDGLATLGRWLMQVPGGAAVVDAVSPYEVVLWGALILSAGIVVLGGVLWVALDGIERLWWRFRRWRYRLDITGVLETWPARAALVVRACGLVVAVVVAPLLPIYSVIALTKLPTVIDALLAADPVIQTVAVALGVAVSLGVGWVVRASLLDVVRALLSFGGRLSLRALVLKRGIPLAAGAVAYLLAWSVIRSVPLAVASALAGVLLGYAVYTTLEAAAYRVSFWTFAPAAPRTITVQAYHVRDGNGTLHPVAVVNGRHKLARDDPDALADAVLETAEQLAAGEQPTPSYASWYATDLLENGIVDERESLGDPDFLAHVDEGRVARALQHADAPGRAWEHTRKRLVNTLRGSDGRVGRVTPRWEIDRAHSDEPEPMWRAFEDRLRRAGVVSKTGDGLRLERDPWAQLTE